MRTLSKTLDHFPFLLSQVAHYIRAQRTTIADYLKYFDFEKEDKVRLDGRYEEKFAKVWRKTFEKLEKESSLALEWLKVCAFLHPDSIPVHWLEEWLKDQDIESPPAERILVLGVLNRYALIRERDSKSESISLHRLLQQSLRSQAFASFH